MCVYLCVYVRGVWCVLIVLPTYTISGLAPLAPTERARGYEAAQTTCM